jgi:methyltransferase family protein
MTRTEIINLLISRRRYRSYLEIGVRNPGDNFDSVTCGDKDGVDPDGHCKYQMTSDEFFAVTRKPYDLVFVDGLHLEPQVHRDVSNSLDRIRRGGAVVVHDCNPPSAQHASEEFNGGAWNGTVWRAFVRLRSARQDLRMFVVDDDWGVGIVTRRAEGVVVDATPERLSPYDGTSALTYEYFAARRAELLDLVSPSDLAAMIPSLR